MPEGDTIHRTANRLRALLEGKEPDEIATPHPRHTYERWPERLRNRAVASVDAHGKHLFVRFEGNLTLHSHLRMTGAWGVYGPGQRWGRSPRRAWLVLKTGEREAVQFDGPVLELRDDAQLRLDPRLVTLGPDILAEDFDTSAVLRRLRNDGDQARPFGEALIDQRVVAGIGNIWKAEACFAAGVDPWRSVAAVSESEALAVLKAARERMAESAHAGSHARPRAVYRRAGMPCPRCRGKILSRGQGERNRTTYWCPSCQG
jgi:endonuclease VIII